MHLVYLSFQTTVCCNECLKHLIFGDALYYNSKYCLPYYFIMFSSLGFIFQESPYPELFVGDASLGHLLYAHKVDLFVVFHVIGHCSLIFYILYDGLLCDFTVLLCNVF